MPKTKRTPEQQQIRQQKERRGPSFTSVVETAGPLGRSISVQSSKQIEPKKKDITVDCVDIEETLNSGYIEDLELQFRAPLGLRCNSLANKQLLFTNPKENIALYIWYNFLEETSHNELFKYLQDSEIRYDITVHEKYGHKYIQPILRSWYIDFKQIENSLQKPTTLETTAPSIDLTKSLDEVEDPFLLEGAAQIEPVASGEFRPSREDIGGSDVAGSSSERTTASEPHCPPNYELRVVPPAAPGVPRLPRPYIYKYMGGTRVRVPNPAYHLVQQMNATLQQLRDVITTTTNTSYNSTFIGAYPTGRFACGYHQDNNTTLYDPALIGDLSVGIATRTLRFRHKQTKEDLISIDLPPNSFLLTVGANWQKLYEHSLLPSKKVQDPRFCLIYHLVHPQTQSSSNYTMPKNAPLHIGPYSKLEPILKKYFEESEIRIKNKVDFGGESVNTYEGRIFNSRLELYLDQDGHKTPVSGICGTGSCGAFSILMNGAGYDLDKGTYFIYSGTGGRKNRKQVKSQTFEGRGNAALVRSFRDKMVIRVFRGYQHHFSPPLSGFRYDGCYIVIGYYYAKTSEDLDICKFLFIKDTISDKYKYLQKEGVFNNIEQMLNVYTDI